MGTVTASESATNSISNLSLLRQLQQRESIVNARLRLMLFRHAYVPYTKLIELIVWIRLLQIGCHAPSRMNNKSNENKLFINETILKNINVYVKSKIFPVRYVGKIMLLYIASIFLKLTIHASMFFSYLMLK